MLFHVSGSNATVHIYASRADCCAVVYFAPSHTGVMQEQKVVQLEIDQTGKTLCGPATLIIGTLGGSGHHGGNNWPGFPSTTQCG